MMNAKLDTVFIRTNTNSPATFNASQTYNGISVGTATAQAADLQNRNMSFDRAILDELQAALNTQSSSSVHVAERIAREVERICTKSDRIQTSGKVEMWQLALARHRIQKIHAYFELGSRRGRVELHSNLSMMVYRHIAPSHANLGFQGRYNHIEDFLQGFYIEVLRAFRREHDVAPDYTPKTRVELTEYMAFSEQYAKRRISLPGRKGQQLVILRAQGYAKGQPPEMSLDVEMAIDSAKSEADESQFCGPPSA
jgi:hypothetical protein